MKRNRLIGDIHGIDAASNKTSMQVATADYRIPSL